MLCYAKTSNKLGSDELWLSLWARLDKLGGPLIVASVIRIKTKNASIVLLLKLKKISINNFLRKIFYVINLGNDSVHFLI